MKKVISISILALVLSLSLTGCEWLNNKIQESVSGVVDDVNSTMEEVSQEAAESLGGGEEAPAEGDAMTEEAK